MNGNYMSYDDFCEKHNYAMKQCMNHPAIDVMSKKSRHLHAASRCAKLLFGYAGKSTSTKPDTADDVKALYSFFVRCNVFSNNDAEEKLDRCLFGRNYSVATFDHCAGRQIIDNQRKLPLTEQENRLMSSFQSEDDSVDGLDDDNNDENYVDAGDEVENIDGDVDDSLSVNSTASEVNSTVSNDENTGKWPSMNKKGLRDLFSVETDRFKSAVRKRMTTIAIAEKYEKTIVDSVKYFNAKMEREMELLRKQRNSRSERMSRNELPHEKAVRLSRMEYMVN
jgi:DNA repair ATPase RecN